MNTFELHEKRISPPVFLPEHYTRNVPKDKDEENRTVGLILYRNHLLNVINYVEILHPLFKNDDEIWNQQ